MNRILLSTTLALSFSFSVQASTELFISEYIEGSSYNKAIEIYNGTGQSIDLSAYEMQFYFNGNTAAGRTINLTGTVASGDVFVVAHSSADTSILNQADQTSGGSWFNGDDALTLLNGGAIIDSIGTVGIDPGSQWGTADTSTQDNTLQRNSNISSGDVDAYNAFNPGTEWQGLTNNTFNGLGSHTSDTGTGGTQPPPTPPAPTGLVINEIDADTAGSDKAEFIELFDGGTGNTDLTGHVIVLYNGSGDASYAAYDLDAYQTDANGYFVLGNAAVSGVDLVIPNGKLQNGADAVALYLANSTDFPNNTPITKTNLIDAIVYGTSDANDSGLLSLLNTAQPQVNENSAGNKVTHSNQRCANGAGGTLNTDSFIQMDPTPKMTNQCAVFSACGSPASQIHTLQGTADTSPAVGTVHTIEAIVSADFQDTSTQLSGFYVQEEANQADNNALSSEGIFIYDNAFGVDVVPGDLVRITGTVDEFFGLTQMKTLTEVTVCSQGNNLQPTNVNLPFADANYLERYEGMLISLPQTLTVTENYNLGRYGEVLVSSGGRLFTPTNIVAPGAQANAQQAMNDLNKLVIDDTSSKQNPDPVIHPSPKLTALNTLRSGDGVTNATGVLSYSASAYRIYPTQTINFTSVNNRTTSPILPATGSLKVASFNVLNYFNGDGNGGGFPTARGADTQTEFNRQRDKIINAILAMNADIIGLMEIENDGYTTNSAIADLVNGLNAAATANTSYAFVNPGISKIGTDAIAVGFIYRVETVQLTGMAALLNSSVDSLFNDQKNRPALAQTFKEISSNAQLTIAVNHFKSKGSSCASIGDPDTGDGQGNCNLTRTNAATALVNWLATDPTNSGDTDYLIIGDLNAYAKEDPITAIKTAGYTNLVESLVGPSAYSYVFKGQAGYLDHALANASLAPQVSGINEWHINADEPRVLDYNEEFKTANQQLEFYSSDVYRASDHDPVVVELNLVK